VCRALDEMFEESTNRGIQMGIEQGIEQGIELNRFEVYQTMLDKGFSIKTIASIFSVSEESIEKLLMKA
jgi:predicted transposase/invertase (TIGR01784 family)